MELSGPLRVYGGVPGCRWRDGVIEVSGPLRVYGGYPGCRWRGGVMG